MAQKKEKTNKAQQEAGPDRKEIKGIIFLLISLLLGVSLFTYYPDDPIFWLKSGGMDKVHNMFGSVGAHIAGYLFHTLGFSSFWLVIIFFIMSILSFKGRSLLPPLRSIISIVLLLLSFSGILGLQMEGSVPYRGGELQSGGLAGYYVSGFAKEVLNFFGANVLLFTVFLISLMICTKISFGRILSKILLVTSGLIRRIKEYKTKRDEKKRKKSARKSILKKEGTKGKGKVKIIEPKKKKYKPPEQESFSFMDAAGKFKLPSLDLLDDPPAEKWVNIQRESLEMNARRLERKLNDFGVEGEVVEVLPGPVITMYEYKPAAGVKISKVAGLADDLTLALRAPSVRIVAPIPGKAAIGIEIANNKRESVYLKEVLSSRDYKDSSNRLTIALGMDIIGSPFITDLARMPHLLVAGATGTGKSVSLNAMINSLLFKIPPDMAKLLIIDPKRIELSIYRDIPHLLHPVVTEPKEATRLLRWALGEMEHRYMLLSDRGVRNIEAYNRKVLKQKKTASDDGEETGKILPYIILVIDELADLMMVSSREVEESITRLAQMARAAGIHLIIATQRPSVDVLTGIIKANFPTRISFQVSSKVDSRTILDTIGAEHLLGEGDMLFMPPGVGRLNRIHGAYISEEEVKRVTDFLREQMKPDYDTSLMSQVAKDEEEEEDELEKDEKYDKAVDLVIKTGQASISMIQRKLRVGYNRAARMIEIMEKEGIVGPSDGVKARDVLGRRD